MDNDKRVNRIEGVVEESLPATNFRVKLPDGRTILAHLAGKMRLHHIKTVPGDRVLVEMTSYDSDRGRIIRRF